MLTAFRDPRKMTSVTHFAVRMCIKAMARTARMPVRQIVLLKMCSELHIGQVSSVLKYHLSICFSVA